MDIEALKDMVNAKINNDARRGGVWTLGDLRAGLSALPAETLVVLADGTSLGAATSYRGYYERLALEPVAEARTVDEVIAVLDRADGDMFYGYKGGEYYMDRHTFVHVAEWGDCGPFISGLRIEADRVVIETKEEVF